MAELWFIRHFRTPWNAKGRLQGRCDVAIDDPLGDADCKTLAAGRVALAGVAFGAVWSSPALRARQTAALFGFDAPAILPEMAELDFGGFEGQLWSDLEAAHPGRWRTAPQNLPLGEPFSAFVARVAAVLARAAALPGGPVLAFGHGAWSGCLRCLHEGHDPATMAARGIGNGEILRLVPQRGLAPCAP